MKTTLEIPDDLMRAVKIRAVEEDKKLKDMVAELLRLGLDQPVAEGSPVRHRVTLPLVQTRHPAPPGEELTPESVHEILVQDEVDRALGRQ